MLFAPGNLPSIPRSGSRAGCVISCIPCGSEAQPEGGGGLNVCVTGVAGPDLVQSPVPGQTVFALLQEQTVCALLQEQTVCALLREKFWWT